MINRILFVTILCYSINLCSQNLNDSWQIGIGTGITKFNQKDALFIGDRHQLQLPVLSLTVPVSERLSVSGAMSLTSIDDLGFIKNSVRYSSMDASLRYNFNAVLNKFSSYIFVGGSIVDSELKSTPTFNIGAGGIYWFTNTIGLNPQVYYKYSADSYESMRSHIQATLSLVFKLKTKDNRKGLKSGTRCYYNQHL